MHLSGINDVAHSSFHVLTHDHHERRAYAQEAQQLGDPRVFHHAQRAQRPQHARPAAKRVHQPLHQLHRGGLALKRHVLSRGLLEEGANAGVALLQVILGFVDKGLDGLLRVYRMRRRCVGYSVACQVTFATYKSVLRTLWHVEGRGLSRQHGLACNASGRAQERPTLHVVVSRAE